jgi:Holliday junction resolvase RusA-like endonuclease
VNVRFRVYGLPAPKGSQEFIRAPQGHRYVKESSPRLPRWKVDIQEAIMVSHVRALKRTPFTGPVSVTVTFYLPHPKGPSVHGDWPLGAPDLDKLERGLGDGLQDASIVLNDSQIVSWRSLKVWETPVEKPGADVLVSDAVAAVMERS